MLTKLILKHQPENYQIRKNTLNIQKTVIGTVNGLQKNV